MKVLKFRLKLNHFIGSAKVLWRSKISLIDGIRVRAPYARYVLKRECPKRFDIYLLIVNLLNLVGRKQGCGGQLMSCVIRLKGCKISS